MNSVDFFEGFVRLERHNADFSAESVGDVVETVDATDDTVGEVEAFRGGDVAARIVEGAVY